MSEAQTVQGPSPCEEILAADGAANRKERSRQRHGDAGQLGDRYQEGEAKPEILAHVAVFDQNQLLAPIAGISETVM